MRTGPYEVRKPVWVTGQHACNKGVRLLRIADVDHVVGLAGVRLRASGGTAVNDHRPIGGRIIAFYETAAMVKRPFQAGC